MTAAPPLAAWRAEFPILGNTTYLISNSLGAMPRGAADALGRYTKAWAERGVRAWEEGWWEMPVAVGDRVAGLIGAPKGSVTMHQNVTLAEAVVLSCFEPGARRDKVVFEDGNFHSVQYLYAAQPGLVVTPVPVERLVDAIDERTLLVPVSHVLYKNAYVQDVPAIVEKAHRVGARVVLDVYHAAGVLPLDVTALGVDFAVGGCLKWLCGGPGNAFLYVRPDLAHLAPRLTGWMGHAAPFAFEPPPIRRAEGPFRFLNDGSLIRVEPRKNLSCGIINIRHEYTNRTSSLEPVMMRAVQLYHFATTAFPLSPLPVRSFLAFSVRQLRFNKPSP